jgi:hypothetical protein
MDHAPIALIHVVVHVIVAVLIHSRRARRGRRLD